MRRHVYMFHGNFYDGGSAADYLANIYIFFFFFFFFFWMKVWNFESSEIYTHYLLKIGQSFFNKNFPK